MNDGNCERLLDPSKTKILIQIKKFIAAVYRATTAITISAVRNFKLNRIATSVFDSKRVQLFEIFEYLPSPTSYLFNRITAIFTLATTPSNQQNQQTPSTETLTKETTIVLNSAVP